jgi:diguanylate cyclase (GGDEF)-like protein
LRDGQSQILRMIALSAPLEEVLERLMHLVESQLTGIHASVLLLDEDGGHLRSGAAPSLSRAYTKTIDGLPIGPSAGSCGAAAFRREAVIVKDIMQDPLWEDWRELAATHGYRSCWSTPIFSHQGAVLGTFAMYSATVREPSQAETRHIEEATNIAGIAIERKQSEDRIHFLANHDALTGLPNRALLESRLSQAISSAERNDCWAAVVFVDLDNFKIVNDSLGHNAGDELLKIVSRRMADGVRTTDTVIRLGGDEFIIVLLDQPKRADIVAAKIQTLTADIAAPVRLLGHDLKVTSSMGIALYPGDGADADALIANADAAMYRAKALGRDNFQFYTPALNAGMQKTSLLQERLQNAAGRAERDKSPTKPD